VEKPKEKASPDEKSGGKGGGKKAKNAKKGPDSRLNFTPSQRTPPLPSWMGNELKETKNKEVKEINDPRNHVDLSHSGKRRT